MDTGSGQMPAEQPFSLLLSLYGDPEQAEIFSERATVQRWMDVERELAQAQASLGLIPAEQASLVASAATTEGLDLGLLRQESRVVGYPILPLVRAITERMGNGVTFVHFGATTQDIMDTGLALQLVDTITLLLRRLHEVGTVLVSMVEEHSRTVMAARTHGQQAVPTTFGAKVAVVLTEFARHYERGVTLRDRVGVVSLYGAGGTSAALGPQAGEVRRALARGLGLRVDDVPWHVARDRLVEFGQFCVLVAGTTGRVAREIIDLSRTEVDELRESWSHHRGASSTMPQKANPILSEAVVGMAEAVNGLAAALPQALRAGHERAAGEWQLEWEVVPRIAVLTAGCLRTLREAVEGLQVNSDRMRTNLLHDGARVMAEAYMMRIAQTAGRERAHDLVYGAAMRSRRTGQPLLDVLNEDQTVLDEVGWLEVIAPESYTGDCERICTSAISAWRHTVRGHSDD